MIAKAVIFFATLALVLIVASYPRTWGHWVYLGLLGVYLLARIVPGWYRRNVRGE